MNVSVRKLIFKKGNNGFKIRFFQTTCCLRLGFVNQDYVCFGLDREIVPARQTDDRLPGRKRREMGVKGGGR